MTSLFGHAFNETILKELEQHEAVAADEARNREQQLGVASSLPVADFAAEAALAGAAAAAADDELADGARGAGASAERDCLVHETHGVCANGGQCIRLFGTGACSCLEGFSGHHCEDINDDAAVDAAAAAVPMGLEDAAAATAVAQEQQRLAEAISKVKAKDEEADHLLEMAVLAGTRGPLAQSLLVEVTDEAGALPTHPRTHRRMKRLAFPTQVLC